MNIYIINVFIVIFYFIITRFIKNNRNRENTFLILAFMQLLFVLGLRAPNVGVDLKSYIPFYRLNGVYSLSKLFNAGFENGYVIYNYIIYNMFNGSEQVFLFITAIISLIGPIYIIKKYSKNYFFSIYIYVLFQFYIFSFYGLRQSIAMTILLFSIPFAIQRKFIKFMFFVLLASTFHLSAIVFSIIYFIVNFKINTKRLMILSVVGIVLSVFGGTVINFILKYFYSEYIITGFSSGGYTHLLMLILIIILASFVKNKDEEVEDNFWYNMMILGCFIQLFATKKPIINRLTIYYSVASILLIPNSIEKFKDKKMRMILKASVLILFYIFFMLSIKNTNIFNPYNFFWEV